MKKSLIEAVKKLLGKLGAEEIEGNDLIEVINNGANVITNTGSSYTPFIATFTYNVDTQTFTCDKTWAEISEVELVNFRLYMEEKFIYLNLIDARNSTLPDHPYIGGTFISNMTQISIFIND